MTTIAIRYLTGHAVATRVTRDSAEWPPHPGRVFMAMAAAYFQTGGDAQERQALEWLETQEMPSISASDCTARTLVGVYVPVNDKLSLPRGKQERTFPTVRPDHDTVYLTWQSEAPNEVRTALANLCGKVTRIGHSSSLTQLWLAEDNPPEEANWLPQDGISGTAERLRVASHGSLKYLEEEFNADPRANYAAMSAALADAEGKEKAQLKKSLAAAFPSGEPELRRPKLSTWAGYRQRTAPEPHSEGAVKGLFDGNSVIILGQTSGDRLGLESTLQLTGALRDAAMKAAGKPAPEWLTGHAADGAPSKQPHVAFFPLPFVDFEHADGHLLGLAMAIPRGIENDPGLRRVLAALLFNHDGEDRTIHLWRTTGGNSVKRIVWDWRLQRSSGYEARSALQLARWTKPSKIWASVTPVVLHHYPKKNRPAHVEEIISEAFLSAGLPKPTAIRTQPVSYFRGAGHISDMPEFSEGGERLCRYQTHIVAEFNRPVEGPVLVGRGRFRGYGLCRPVRSTPDEQSETA